jgi:4-amino-4-deoxy-L-arabinose transferase-like glycosyltransferase
LSHPDSQHEIPDFPFWKYAIIACLFAVGVRGTVLWLLATNLQQDQDGYAQLAENLRSFGIYGQVMPESIRAVIAPSAKHAVESAQHDSETSETLTLPTAYRPPLYPLILTICVVQGKLNLWAVAALHLALGVASALLTFLIGWRLNMGRASLLASIGVTLDPLLLYQSTLVMTETLATVCLLAGLVLVWRSAQRQMIGSAILAGVICGCAILCRPTFLFWTAALALMLYFHGSNKAQRIKFAIVFGCAAALMILPWGIRNWVVMGKPILATTHGGYTLLLANNDSLFQHQSQAFWPSAWTRDEQFIRWDNAAIEQAIQQHSQRHWELTYDQLCRDKALKDISAHPAGFVKASLLRLIELWRPLPNQIDPHESTLSAVVRYLIAFWYTVVMIMALVGFVRLGARVIQTPWCWVLLICVVLTAIHLVFWSNMRMRSPAMPIVYLLAVQAWVRLPAKNVHREPPAQI